MRSDCEIVSFVNVSPIDAFDVSESYEVFLFSIRAFYALVLSNFVCKHELRCMNLKQFETLWDDVVAVSVGPIILYVL